jgi:hypothetical protein
MAGPSPLQLERVRECLLVCAYKVGQVLPSVSHVLSAPHCVRGWYPYEDLPIFGVHRMWLAGDGCIQGLRNLSGVVGLELSTRFRVLSRGQSSSKM